MRLFGSDRVASIMEKLGLEEGEEVLLAPPLTAGDETDSREDQVSQGRPKDLAPPEKPPAKETRAPEDGAPEKAPGK